MINIAVIGLGNIAERVIEGIKEVKEANLYAVISKDKNKAISFFEQYGADVYYDNYETALQDPKIDLVYICVINPLHYAIIKLCLLNNKHVICEKPMVLKEEEVDELYDIAVSKGLFLMEAHKAVFIKLHQEVKKLIKDDVIGKIINIKADYCVNVNYPEKHWLLNEDYGGCLNDIGVYPISFCNSIADAHIKEIYGINYFKEGYDCNVGSNIILRYANDISANIECSWLHNTYNKGKAYIFGTKGRIEILNYWKNNKAKIILSDKEYELITENGSEFKYQIEEAIKGIKEGLNCSHKFNVDNIKEVIKVLNKMKKG